MHDFDQVRYYVRGGENYSKQIFQPGDCVYKGAAHPYAALLFLEHQASPEVQKIIDQQEPLKSSIYANGEIAKIVKGKKTSVNDFRSYKNTAKWVEMVVEAYGFPRAQIK